MEARHDNPLRNDLNSNSNVYKVESYNQEFNRNDSDDFGEGEAEDT